MAKAAHATTLSTVERKWNTFEAASGPQGCLKRVVGSVACNIGYYVIGKN